MRSEGRFLPNILPILLSTVLCLSFVLGVAGEGALAVDYLVQSGETTLSTTETQKTVPLDTTVDSSHSFFLVFSSSNQNANTRPERFVVNGQLLSDGTGLTLRRNDSVEVANVSYSVIQHPDITVQEGTELMDVGVASFNVPLSPAVDTSKSLVILHRRTAAGIADHSDSQLTGYLTSPTNLFVQRDTTATAVRFRWQVVTFTDATTIQTGEDTFPNDVTLAGKTLTTPVDPTRSWLYFTVRCNGSGMSYSMVRGRIQNSTTLQFERYNANSGVNPTVRWYVVEFPSGQGAKVERNLLNTAATTDLILNGTLTTPIDKTQTFLYHTSRGNGDGNAYARPYWVNRFTSCTGDDCSGVQFERWYYGQHGGISWEAVTMPSCASPGTPSGPNPLNGATGVSVDADLDWDDSPNATAYDVYFDTVDPPVTQVASDITSSNHTLPTLSTGTQYFWKVIAKNACGDVEGPVWYFTTCPPAPAAPTNPSPGDGTTDLSVDADLNWDDSANATAYDVYLDTMDPPATKVASDIADSSLTLDRLICNTHYYWKVVAKNACNNTDGPVWDFVTEDLPDPGVPANPDPLNGATDVLLDTDLDWDDSTNAECYNVYFGTDPDPPIYATGVTASDYALPTLGSNTLYYWKIVAKNRCATIPGPIWSFTTLCPTPAAPSNPSPAHLATEIPIDSMLNWDDAVGADSYEVYFGTSPSPPYVTDTTDSDYTPTLDYGTHYYWKIVAKSDCGESTTGSTWEFTTSSCPEPGEPGNPSPADDATGVSINAYLNWDDSSNTDAYEVYFGADPDPPYVTDTTSSVYYPTLDYNTHYYWKIVAKSDCGKSTAGQIWDFTTEPCPTPALPSDPSPPDGATGVSVDAILDWEASANADAYEVYFGTAPDPPYVTDTTFSSHSPTLNHDTHYYWKIVAKNDCGNSSTGPVWDFTTGSEPTGDRFASASGSNSPPYTSWATAAHNIQDAVNAALAGETVLVDDGTFTENVTISKNNLILQSRNGRSATFIEGQVRFDASAADLTGCILDGFDIEVASSTGIVYLDAQDPHQISGVTVQNCKLHDNSYSTWPYLNACGIVMKGKVSAAILGNQIYNNKFRGIGSYYDGSYYQHFGTDPASPVVIKGNIIHDNGGSGVEVNGYKPAAWPNPPEISLTIGGPDRADANHIYNHLSMLVAGIELGFLDTVVIENNEIHNNGNMYGAGIRIDATVDTTIKANDIYENGFAGIRLAPDGGFPMPDPDGPGGPIPGGNNRITIGGPLDADGNDIFDNGNAGIAIYVSGSIFDPIPVMGSSIQKNHIHHNDRAGITIGRDENGGNAASFSETLIITQNDISYNGRGGIGIHTGCELEITKNNIHHSMARGGIHTGDEWGLFSQNIGDAVLTVRQNKVHHNFLGGMDIRHAAADVENNLVYKNYRVGVRVGPAAVGVTNNTLSYNGNSGRGGGIIYDDPETCDPACEDGSGNCAADCEPFGFPPDPFPIENNISAYNERAGIMACFYSVELFRDHNLVYSNNQSYLSEWCDSCASPDCSTGTRIGRRRCIGAQLGRGCNDDSLFCCSAPMASGPLPGETLVFADPLFEDMDNDDYQLQTGSPAINAGDCGGSPCDMGAYGGDYPIVDSEIPDFSY